MQNLFSTPTPVKEISYMTLEKKDEMLKDIEKNYKMVELFCLNLDILNQTIQNDPFFEDSPQKKSMLIKMATFYLNHNDLNIFKKTDYFCNEKHKICICNKSAQNYRDLCKSEKYNNNKKYVSWSVEGRDPF